MALGAQRDQLMRLILFDGLRPAVIGLAMGSAASAGITQLIGSMLYDTDRSTLLYTLRLFLLCCWLLLWPV